VRSLQGHIRKAEEGLIWTLVHQPAAAMAALRLMEPEDLKGLITENILLTARELTVRPDDVPTTLMERLSTQEAQLLASVAAQRSAPVTLPDLCVVALKYVRLEREFAEVQRELRRLQEVGEKGPILLTTLRRKLELSRALAAIDVPKELQ